MKVFTLLSLLLLIACNDSTNKKEDKKTTPPTAQKQQESVKGKPTVPTVENQVNTEVQKTDPINKKDLDEIKSKIKEKVIVGETDETEILSVKKKETKYDSTTSVFAGQKIEIEEISENPNAKEKKKKDPKVEELILED